MSKLSFRARALDANKSLPVYHAEDVPDLPAMASVNRVVPQMPTGMEKVEESEHHLQRAITAQQIYGEAQRLIIPTPDTILYESDYKQLKKRNAVMPKQLIHVQAFTLEDELPDYDCDDEDNSWLLLYNNRNPDEPLTILELESIIDTLEKGCSARLEPDSFQLFTLNDAHALLKKTDKVVDSVFEYWKQKRSSIGFPLALPVRTEKKDGSALHDPYIAFRRRVEKMQTRKNRKNDEASYEKMLALRRDLKRACLILEMVKLREEQKRKLLETTIKVLETRYSNKDFEGELLHQCYDLLKRRIHTPSNSNLPSNTTANNSSNTLNNSTVNINPSNNVPIINTIPTKLTIPNERTGVSLEERLKRPDYEERKRHGMKMPKPGTTSNEYAEVVEMDSKENIPVTSNSEEVVIKEPVSSTPPTRPPPRVVIDSEPVLPDGPDGKYTFRRKKGVTYHAPRYDSMGNWPWTHPVEGGSADPRYCYCCTSIQKRCSCIGFARRRIGRGGRIMFDRAYSPYDDLSPQSSKLKGSHSETISEADAPLPDRVPPWPHFKPCIDSSDSDESRSAYFGLSSWTLKDNNTSNIDTSQTFNKPPMQSTFSSQPTSKFRIHPYPSRNSNYPSRNSNQTRSSAINNQVFIASLAASLSKSSDLQHVILKKNRIHQNPINGTIFTSPSKFCSVTQHATISSSRPASTAPSSTIFQLNFPVVVSSISSSTSSQKLNSTSTSSSGGSGSCGTNIISTKNAGSNNPNYNYSYHHCRNNNPITNPHDTNSNGSNSNGSNNFSKSNSSNSQGSNSGTSESTSSSNNDSNNNSNNSNNNNNNNNNNNSDNNTNNNNKTHSNSHNNGGNGNKNPGKNRKNIGNNCNASCNNREDFNSSSNSISSDSGNGCSNGDVIDIDSNSGCDNYLSESKMNCSNDDEHCTSSDVIIDAADPKSSSNSGQSQRNHVPTSSSESSSNSRTHQQQQQQQQQQQHHGPVSQSLLRQPINIVKNSYVTQKLLSQQVKAVCQ